MDSHEDLKRFNQKIGKDNEKLWGVEPPYHGGFSRIMSDEENNKVIDRWVAESNKHIGEITIPHIGEWPPNLDNLYGSQTNEWVTSDLIRHYAEAFGDRNPMWRNPNYARNTVWGGMIAQPMIIDSICHYGAGKYIHFTEDYRFNSLTLYPEKEDVQWFGVFRPGDKIKVIQKFTGVVEEETHLPPPARMFGQCNRRWFINQREETVAIADYVMVNIMNIPEDYPTRSPWKGWKRKRRRLTDEERDSIYRGYNEEKWRGSDTLYWEDVNEGEESQPHVVGPTSIYDSVSTFQMICGHAVGFAMQWDRIRLNFDFAVLDDEVNAWKCGGECHICDNVGHAPMYHESGQGHVQYQTLHGVRCHALTNWMGDDGFLKSMQNHAIDGVIIGEVLKTKIKVLKKYKEGNEHLVDLSVDTGTLDGDEIMNGNATVRLPSRIDYDIK